MLVVKVKETVEQIAILKKGVVHWNLWRKKNPILVPSLAETLLSQMDLTGVDLRDARLEKANFGFANLSQANLARANLFRANLGACSLREATLDSANLFEAHLGAADLSYASLRGVDLTGANLSGARLNGAALIGTNLTQANLNGTDFTGAVMGHATLAAVDLSKTIGLETIQFVGPSSLGIDTIYWSGQISEVFLRGVGIPESFVTYIPSLIGSAIEYYSCFISYSTADQDFAETLHARLQANGVRCWFAPHDIKAGKKLYLQIDEAIRKYERVLLILSHDSMKSEWVKTEIAKARMRELQENRQVLFPVRIVSFDALKKWECFDSDIGKDTAKEIREYFIPDFSNWKRHDQFKEAFDNLLRDLKPDKPSIPAKGP